MLKKAAVIIPIIDKPQHTLLLTLRSHQVQMHKGQICFPGGQMDKTDASLLDCAYREAFEEIALKKEDIKILDTQQAHPTRTGFLITPFVGLIPSDMTYEPDPLEVSEIFEVPISFLNDHIKQEQIEFNGTFFQTDVIQYRDKKIWGATASIIKTFLQNYPEHLEQIKSAETKT